MTQMVLRIIDGQEEYRHHVRTSKMPITQKFVLRIIETATTEHEQAFLELENGHLLGEAIRNCPGVVTF